jgi:hypothetical protein
VSGVEALHVGSLAPFEVLPLLLPPIEELYLLLPPRMDLMFLVEVVELHAPLHVPLLPFLKGQEVQ